MDKTSRRMPSLDLLRGFESSARHLSFTRAAAELFVTQSAISRQIRALEESVGKELFRRRNRRLELTEAGLALFGTAAHVLAQLDEALLRIRGEDAARPLTVSTTVSFASLWLVPRLAAFRRAHAGVDVRISASNEIVDLDRDRIDLAIRFCEPRLAPPGARRLASERVFPVCSAKLLRITGRPLRTPADLKHHVLLHLDDATGRWPWLNWGQWLDALGLPSVHPGGSVRFSHYDQLIRAAVDGEGVALGRDPLVRAQLAKRELVAPFARSAVSAREYYLITGTRAQASMRVQQFIDWLAAELSGEVPPAGKPGRARGPMP